MPFLHNDMEHLLKQLARHGRGLIVVDALYSTNGSVAPLREVVEIAERSGPKARRGLMPMSSTMAPRSTSSRVDAAKESSGTASTSAMAVGMSRKVASSHGLLTKV